MKKILLLFFFSLSLAVQAQSERSFNWGLSIAINSVEAQIGTPLQSSWGSAFANLNVYGDKIEKSFSFSFIPKYFIRDDVILRFEFEITNLQFVHDINSISSSYHQITHESLEQKIHGYALGIQWGFLNYKRVQLYCGAAISYVNYGDMNFKVHSEIRHLPADTLQSLLETRAVYPGGSAFGIGTLAGFSIHLQRHISLGGEFSSSLMYYKIGGENRLEGTIQNFPGPLLSIDNTVSSNLYEGFQFSKIQSSLNITIWF